MKLTHPTNAHFHESRRGDEYSVRFINIHQWVGYDAVCMSTITPLILSLFCWDGDIRSDVGAVDVRQRNERRVVAVALSAGGVST
jgi:hypothetical protein